MLYRDKIVVRDRTVPAAVNPLSATEQIKNNGVWGTNAVRASVGPAVDVDGLPEFEWRGKRYVVKAEPEPIMALGRLDHYEVTGERTGPA